MFDIYVNILGNYKGQCLLDLGSGPGLKAVITASQWFEEIFLSDISKDNVAYLRKWLEGDAGVTEALRCQMSYFALKEEKWLVVLPGSLIKIIRFLKHYHL